MSHIKKIILIKIIGKTNNLMPLKNINAEHEDDIAVEAMRESFSAGGTVSVCRRPRF
jgi:hypothetical protein